MTPLTKKRIINLSFIVVLLLTFVIFNALLQANMAHSQINGELKIIHNKKLIRTHRWCGYFIICNQQY